jgi:Baseplate J-like protein
VIYRCCTLKRKSAILNNPAVALNGIDYLEVVDQESSAPTSPPQQTILPQQTLLVHCLKTVPSNLTPGNVLITGGEGITDITAISVKPAPAPEQNVLIVQTSKTGDFSTYILKLVNSNTQAAEGPFAITQVLAGFDPQLAEVSFSFKVGCGPDFDCQPSSLNCPQNPPTPPAINYLAKDYGTFRTLILDRLNQLLPAWGGTTQPDLGVALAELIACRCDYLSYQQDAIATEAYIETARSRISLRRHARLVDYQVHDGCNSRTWIRLTVTADGVFLDRTLTRFYTDTPGMTSSLAVGAGNEEAAILSGVQVFQPMQDAVLYKAHNQIQFYTWGDAECCLPQGAVEATLNGYYPDLKPGDVLIFQEVIGPQTGNSADADLRHRCAVRLTQVATQDANGNLLVDPLFDQNGEPISNPAAQNPAQVTEIQWSKPDGLPFPVCISSTHVDSTGTKQTVENVSLAFGNVVLADHGLSLAGINLGTVPEPRLFLPLDPSADRCQPTASVPLPVRFRPKIPDSPLTQAVPLALTGVPVTPSIVLVGPGGSASLTDANGFVCLTLQAAKAAAWPQFFEVMLRPNQTNPANFDLSVVYNPAGAATGGSSPPTQITLESFTNLSFNPADTNYVAFQINSLSKLIRVPPSYVPPATAPSNYPATPTTLPSAGTLSLQTSGSPPVTYLMLQVTNPNSWPEYFGFLAQDILPASAVGRQPELSTYSLTIVYYPPSGGVGIALPITVEKFTGLSLINIDSQFNSQLFAIQSFTGAPDTSLAASDLMNVDPSETVPQITLEDQAGNQWGAAQDLLGSGELDRVFVVETESDGTARLRFATPLDPGSISGVTNGMLPNPGATFAATYRIGNGTAGNIGAESLVYLATADARIQSCTNPLPATGGTDPETNDQIRRRAPQAFLSQGPSALQRSVTMADYETVAETNPQVKQAVASLRWTGSGYSVFIAVEPVGGGNLSSNLQSSLVKNVERFRLAGQGLQLESPQYVSLQVTLVICVDPNYFQTDVEQGLLQVLGNQILPNGQRGFFYPDNFTFGQTVFLSPIYAVARSVPGVVSVNATQFQPLGPISTQYLTTGQIKLGSLQVARLDNDSSFPDHGQLTLVMQGGK